MKKILALLLALVMTLSLTACGSKDDTSSDVAVSGDNVSSENADNETDSESETESASKTETESETESEKETGKNETTKPQDSGSTGNSGNKKPATDTQKPTGNTPSNTQKPSSSDTTKPSSSTSNNASENDGFKEFKFVSKKLANPYITKNGQDLLTRLYGNNHTIQAGDSVTWDIVLTSGSISDWKILATGGTIKQNGNRVTITADGTYDHVAITVVSKKIGSMVRFNSTPYDVVTYYEGKITDNSAQISRQLELYAERKGMKRVSGVDIWGYVWNPTLKKRDVNLSLTHNIDAGCDYILIVNNPDWVDEAIWLIDEYEKMGVITFGLSVNFKGGFSAAADTAESAKNLKK